MPLRTKVAARKKKIIARPKKRKTVARIKIIGRVVHYYDRIGVAIIELARPIRLGDMVHMKKGDLDHIQVVHSLHIDHQPVERAAKGQVVGMRVDLPVHEGALVMPAQA